MPIVAYSSLHKSQLAQNIFSGEFKKYWADADAVSTIWDNFFLIKWFIYPLKPTPYRVEVDVEVCSRLSSIYIKLKLFAWKIIYRRLLIDWNLTMTLPLFVNTKCLQERAPTSNYSKIISFQPLNALCKNKTRSYCLIRTNFSKRKNCFHLSKATAQIQRIQKFHYKYLSKHIRIHKFHLQRNGIQKMHNDDDMMAWKLQSREDRIWNKIVYFRMHLTF